LLSAVVVIGAIVVVVIHRQHLTQHEAQTRSAAAFTDPGGQTSDAGPDVEPSAVPKPISASVAPRTADRPTPDKDPLAGYIPPPPGGSAQGEAPSWEGGLSEDEQQQVNKAIDRGVAFLKTRLAASDEYTGRTGGQALAGLTLLSCGVAPDDRIVRKVAERVHKDADGETRTYDLALAILFLDRLGDPKDRDLIRTLGMRLVAGQNAGGGWTYNCPLIESGERDDLIGALESLGPPDTPGRVSGSEGNNRMARPETGRVPDPAPRRTVKLDDLPGNLRNLPVIQFRLGATVHVAGTGDNSNTQFAILALWVARKYGLPVERTVALVDARFRRSQNEDGSWGYHPRTQNWRDSMTCAGLLGLAVSRGIVRDSEVQKGSAHDPDIARGLHFLAGRIGSSAHDTDNPKGPGRIVGADAHGDLYFLWSVERVAVAYDLRAFEGKEWYRWGANRIVKHQNSNGSWRETFAGLPDTCFALLFLKRVNVAQDLTATLRSIGSPTEQRTSGAGAVNRGPSK
jgi:hypothetical protein